MLGVLKKKENTVISLHNLHSSFNHAFLIRVRLLGSRVELWLCLHVHLSVACDPSCLKDSLTWVGNIIKDDPRFCTFWHRCGHFAKIYTVRAGRQLTCSHLKQPRENGWHKLVQQWPQGKGSHTLKKKKKTCHGRHSRWSRNLTALNSIIVLRRPGHRISDDYSSPLFPCQCEACSLFMYTLLYIYIYSTNQDINSLSSTAAFASSKQDLTAVT